MIHGASFGNGAITPIQEVGFCQNPALNAGDVEAVNAFFEAADVAGCNDRLLAASQEDGFHTEIVETAPLHGQRLMLAHDLAQLMYGSPNTANAGALVRK